MKLNDIGLIFRFFYGLVKLRMADSDLVMIDAGEPDNAVAVIVEDSDALDSMAILPLMR